MNKLSSNIKKIALSLLVVGLAIGTQAFKTAESNVAEGDLYGSRLGINPYEKLSDPYDPSECVGNPTKHCFYSVTTAGAGTVTAPSYSEAQLEIWASQPTPFVTRSSTTGIYNGD
ncbi:hypothetical protein QG516_24705 [Pedobacter gandavensis]|uniref:hypothetical protein n=1 Tax=Pedobacter gandavensis TaxID=2679963 RepID=UPI00247B10DF|nr:hypothetical protein [Pedobacter gandavensis]WGQ09719.1 hypothetical protein QG516_24705 [Pedobacter gandavensis]